MIHRRGIALVYINGPRCLPAGVLAAWLTRRPSLFHLHLILARKPEIALTKHCARRVTRILACSGAAAESLLRSDRRLASKLNVLYNPVAEPVRGHLPVRRAEVSDEITIGMVGRITEAKGHRFLFDALVRLSPELRNKTRLIIVGAPAEDCSEDVRYARRLEEHAMEIGLQEKILWTGYREDVSGYYTSMDVLVQASIAEALPMAVLEALQRGIPIIASRTGGIPEIVRHEFNGLLYSTGDENELARSIQRFIEDRSLRDRLRAGAQVPLDGRFSLATFTRNIRHIVCDLCRASNETSATACEGLSTWK